jgi:hypothetical protein
LSLKNITYVEIGWIGQKRIKTREQIHGADVEMMEESTQKNSLNKLTYGKKEVNVGNIHIRSTRFKY